MPSPDVLEVIALRSSRAYQDAETLRRKKFGGSKGLKNIKVKENTKEYSALRLLIGTWEAIGHRILGLPEPERVAFYQTNPIGFMWRLLKPAVEHIRKEAGKQEYAKNFEEVAYAYDAWLKTQPHEYQTGAASGIIALFG